MPIIINETTSDLDGAFEGKESGYNGRSTMHTDTDAAAHLKSSVSVGFLTDRILGYVAHVLLLPSRSMRF